MSENPKERPRIEAALNGNEIARALVEYLIKYRGWPTDVRYDETRLDVGMNVKPSVFSAQIGPMFPGGDSWKP